MIRKSMKQISLFLALVLSIPLTFSACEQKQKEIKISSDVKQEMKNEEKNASKIVKIKDLDLGNMIYTPICWKDDENIVVTDGGSKNNNEIDVENINMGDINVYNVNIKTSKDSKVNTIKDAVCGEVGSKDMYGNFLYMKDNKVCMYNAIENTEKSIYDLSSIIKEQKENLKIKDEKELLKRIYCGFVLGSDKCIYVMAQTSDINCSIRVINTKTGKVTEGSFPVGYFPNLGNVQSLYSLAYNKNKDIFYVTSIYYNFIYECKLKGEKSIIRKRTNAAGQIFDISEDGNDLYLNSLYYKKGKMGIIKYDMEKDKVTEITSDYMDKNGKSQISLFVDVAANYNNNIIGYSINNTVYEKDNKTVSKIQATSFIGDFDGKEIKNNVMLPVEQMEDKNNNNRIMINKKGDSFIYTVLYSDYKDNIIKMYKMKSYVYQVKK
ncbi:hypothetical protein Ccar_02225 [Clostridium carboxidivorans P7]|uniref:Lipoprotein n=1 Tax=Clostridium carboxidivorans P7 TaxID=536227 RepID=C6PYH2_9CLOT|nr:hypothetical protein [Clostridium carboxidivorans]AKN29725.1 hypothetical protein Ccar_02225 [Clostridium carboxidivorans P7]EET85691.1 hypothetical protein CcarbDRAFT_3839 [Clostridium carboxidivorans P7]EFG89332.1 lipoprotein, putative [Clostridium carboxidivorans P7]